MTARQLQQIAAVAKMHGGIITPEQLSAILGTPVERVPFSADELKALCNITMESFAAHDRRESTQRNAPDTHGPNPNYKGPR